MKRLIVIMGLLSLMFTSALMAQPIHRIYRLRTGIWAFCKLHPDRASCQKWSETRRGLIQAAKEVRQDIKGFCQQNPNDDYCKRLKKLKEWRRQYRYKKHVNPSNKINGSQTKQSRSVICPRLRPIGVRPSDLK